MKIVFYASISSALSIAPIFPEGEQIKFTEKVERGNVFTVIEEEVWYEKALSSVFQIEGVREVYTSIHLDKTESQEFMAWKERRAQVGESLYKKITEGIAISKKLARQWHPPAMGQKEIEELVKKNIKDYKNGREKYGLNFRN